MITFRSLGLRRGQRLLIENASFTIHRGQKVGITGANGAGKSSLLELILGRLAPDTGEVAMPPALELAHVAQETPAVGQPALDYVIDGDSELRSIQRRLSEAEGAGDGIALARLHDQFEAVGGYRATARAGRLLHGLGFAPGTETQPVNQFSGGWRMRLNLARALMCRSDLLLLDEPTNHLDLDAVVWLQEWLEGYSGTLLFISHDRDFLDGLADHILHIENRAAVLYSGNFSAFESRRAETLTQQTALYDRQQRELARIQSFVDRFRAQATKARQVQSRLKALDRMALIAKAQADSPFEFSFANPEKTPAPLLKLDAAAAGYGKSVVLSGLTLSVNPGDRIGLVGPNGAGKSTLVKLMAGELPLLSGERILAQELRIGYFAQHQLEQLRPEDSALVHLQRLDPKATERELRGFLGGFGFSNDRALEPIGVFSGGEKSRLALAQVIYGRPNLVLLDEPTNHLDLGARDALVLALQEFAGAVLLVSHDRHLLRTVADSFWLVADGTLEVFPGDLDDYREWSAQHRARTGADAGARSPEPRRERRRSAAERRQARRPLELNQKRAEAAMEKLVVERKNLEAAMADPSLYAGDAKTKLQSLLLEKARIDTALAQAETDWLAASEALELEMSASIMSD